MFIYTTLLAQKMQFMQQGVELQEQKERFQVEQDSRRRQDFGNAFFQLLSFQNEITAQLSCAIPLANTIRSKGIANGKDCFGVWYDELANTYKQSKLTREQKEEVVFAQQHCELFYDKNQAILGHYFRTLYQVCEFIQNADLEADEKRRYASLVRAQLSSCELLLLFYSCFSPLGVEFKSLIEGFGLFKHLDKSLLMSLSHAEFFAPSAYE